MTGKTTYEMLRIKKKTMKTTKLFERNFCHPQLIHGKCKAMASAKPWQVQSHGKYKAMAQGVTIVRILQIFENVRGSVTG